MNSTVQSKGLYEEFRRYQQLENSFTSLQEVIGEELFVKRLDVLIEFCKCLGWEMSRFLEAVRQDIVVRRKHKNECDYEERKEGN